MADFLWRVNKILFKVFSKVHWGVFQWGVSTGLNLVEELVATNFIGILWGVNGELFHK